MMSVYSYLCQHDRYMGLIGVGVILLCAYIFSASRRDIVFKPIINGLFMQFVLAAFILKTHLGHTVFALLASVFNRIYAFAGAGTDFVFGKLADPSSAWGMIFAVKVIPIIIFFGALMSVLFHFGVIQAAVQLVAFVMRPLLGTSGAETLCAAANSMLGQTEAPLLVKNYLEHMTRSEIFVVMVSGFATLSGALLAVYGSMGVPMIHLLSASVMSIPASLVVAKILMPETERPKTIGGRPIELERESKNMLDAIAKGTTDGMGLAVNVVAMLITFISLIALVNYVLLYMGCYTLNDIFACIFSPVAYVLGIAGQDVNVAAALLGQKFVINEFVAYASFAQAQLADRSRVILTYALAGFSNFSCIGIQIGGIGALCPSKRELLTKLGIRALIGGTLVNFLNAAVASILM